ncbi:MAG TPA: farnesyl diphosphate synthase [Myxococcaceae bacterium]|nr:farnesyl diphosphate synthase [Myxococcaceae bacterium]
MASADAFQAKFLAEQKARVESLLTSRLELLASGAPPRLLEAMRYSLLGGGKRLRPILCLAFADVASGSTGGGGKVAEDAACAVEYVHTYSLIHDDLPSMDDDDVRRGRPTSHKVFGEAMAILAGDALLTEAFALLGRDSEPQRGALCGELAGLAGAAGMVGGQVLDIAEDRPADEGYMTRTHRLKTGALIRAACRMGVIASGGSAEALRTADTYGESVGLAFQITDDILDLVGDSSQMGKPTGADERAGRFTFPAVLGLPKSKALAAECVNRALEALSRLDGSPGPLVALARFSIERRT